jgi:hypothetical protein
VPPIMVDAGVMKIVRCPLCDLANEGHRTNCSCGFRLSATKQEISSALRWRAQAHALLMFAGFVVLAAVGGITFAMMYRAETEGGGPVVIFFGLTAAGVSIVAKGFFGWRDAKSRARDVGGSRD